MKVWVTADYLGDDLVRLHRRRPKWALGTRSYPSFGLGYQEVARIFARCLFGRLPRHGSAECFEFELTAKRVKAAKRKGA